MDRYFERYITFWPKYIPPEFSKYASDDPFIDIEEELLLFSQKTKNIAVIGDFNTRTAILDDYVVIDENLNEILNIVDDVECSDDIPNYFILKQNNILQRCNKDTGRVNKYGTKLVYFCKRCNLLIANGRLFSDKGSQPS